MNIPVEEYLNYALSFREQERSLINDFSDWLPLEIIDCHAHTSMKIHCLYINDRLRTRPTTTFPWFEISDHVRINNILYPNKKIRVALFAFPYRGINHKAVNQYLISESIRNTMIIPILCGIPTDIEYTITHLKTGLFRGLKIYPAYSDPPAQMISEYFSDKILSFWESCNGIIILHLPRLIIKCFDDVTSIAKKFPRLRIILAHMGLMYLPTKDLFMVFRKLASFENIFLDTSVVTSSEVFQMALDTFRYKRILFGTDQPYNLIRGRFYFNPKLGPRIITDYPYHWVDTQEQAEFSYHAVDLIHIHWEVLIALREAINKCGESDEAKSYIFAVNAKRLFQL